MLQSALKNRFQLSVRNGNTDNLAYAITVEKKPQLKPSEGTEARGCKFQPVPTVPRGVAKSFPALRRLPATCSTIR
jgi:uncharacterized protein (TIGR03435 family)